MNTNKILIGGVAGGVAAFLLGYLIWGLALNNFMMSHNTAPEGAIREPMVLWAIAVASLATGFLYSIIYGRWANISTLKTGALAGAVIGLLLSINIDFINYATMYAMDMTAIIVDLIAGAIYGALIGGIVAWVLGRGKATA